MTASVAGDHAHPDVVVVAAATTVIGALASLPTRETIENIRRAAYA